MLQYGDENRLNDFRDTTRDVAFQLGLEKEFEALGIPIPKHVKDSHDIFGHIQSIVQPG